MEYVRLGGILSLYAIHKQKGSGERRKIVVYGSTLEQKDFQEYAKKYEKDLKERNVDIMYKDSEIFYVELYGYDGGLKKSIDKKDLEMLIKEIDNMQMGRFEKFIREKNKK